MFYQAKNITQTALLFTLFTGTGHMVSMDRTMDSTNESTTQSNLIERENAIKQYLQENINENTTVEQLSSILGEIGTKVESTDEYKKQKNAAAKKHNSHNDLSRCMHYNKIGRSSQSCEKYAQAYARDTEEAKSCTEAYNNSPEELAWRIAGSYAGFLNVHNMYSAPHSTAHQNYCADRQILSLLQQRIEQKKPESNSILEKLNTRAKILQQSIKEHECMLSKMDKERKKRLKSVLALKEQDYSTSDWLREFRNTCRND